ncbi:ATP-binding cassette domain-containing protein [Staphylococcus hominis]|uniref:ABC transporter ATP-binding protein n=1 Tax=Staphylococcus hominis TaxID=1290 RepID=UPI0012DC10E2|nr:ATP-binding cassette domain-containing protein [Staphylococcus hominis]MCI2847960.1 ATP-binding cassette domain-containing protein [Staphylococcus hominis]MCI2850193.1 ATP-binding cassette domain-containing protein [Staphylococcus hominis]MCI2856818.1 ATP-binding cassette domain-containing protein [Staphylococcus hominis]MCI2887209.1 ATP-binding cassette domain-containing protein [Staphylococcus hominis]QGR78095.1 ATP-binding cassette domain-containing protein [Staphylococcus hominis]
MTCLSFLFNLLNNQNHHTLILSRGDHLINLKHIYKQKHGKTILNDLNWHIETGDNWILYGVNGAGKTTLLNIMNAYESVSQVEIEMFEMVPGKKGYSAENVRQHIGFVSHSLLEKFQDGEKVIDVVLSGIFKSIGLYKEYSDEHIKEAEKLLNLVGMLSYKDQYLGYLSTGQKQKVMIARALIYQPDVLILDEPASGLDFLARDQLLYLLENLNKTYAHLTMIYVTHVIEEIIPLFSKIFLLKEGSCFDKGITKDILTDSIMSKFFNNQIEVIQYRNRYHLYIKYN